MKTKILLLFLFIASCSEKKKDLPADTLSYDPPGATDTRTKKISFQEKKMYAIDSVYAINDFDGARLNGFRKVNDTLYEALILPENAPINMSPWYAFKIWADTTKQINLKLAYQDGTHRYYPKISKNGKDWDMINKSDYTTDSLSAELKLKIGRDTLWLSAQELATTKDNDLWIQKLAQNDFVETEIIGKSKAGKPIKMLNIGNLDSKKMIAVISRQHPPEVTGYLAMQHFIETICSDTELARNFRKQFLTVLVPIVNPDGVDNGHWRHSNGGIDLNRDWAYFRQPETKAVSEALSKMKNENNRKVLFGIDFHSTHEDIYYALTEDKKPERPVVAEWLQRIEKVIPEYKALTEASGENTPTSANWFYRELGTDAVTFEIGDNTKRDFVKLKGKVAAEQMMELLLEQ